MGKAREPAKPERAFTRGGDEQDQGRRKPRESGQTDFRKSGGQQQPGADGEAAEFPGGAGWRKNFNRPQLAGSHGQGQAGSDGERRRLGSGS